MLTTKELLARLRDKGIKNADIARALNVTPSRVTEMYDGTRALKLDEAAKLAAAFELEQAPSQAVSPLPAPISRLVVQYIAEALGASLQERQAEVAELSEDIRAFAEYVADPSVRDRTDFAEAFFRAMRLRRKPAKADRPENGHVQTH